MINNNKHKHSTLFSRGTSALIASFVVALLTISSSSYAGIFAGLDTADFDFDITSYNPGTGNGTSGDSSASGTSNGIGWSIGPTNLFTGRTVTNGTFNFTNGGSNILGQSTDSLHTSSDFTIVFDQMIAVLYVALSNDNTNDSINFGISPDAVQGISVSGTQLLLSSPAQAGLAKFTNINSLSITHINTNFLDGFDLAFHAQAKDVTAPSALVFLVLGMLMVGARKTRFI